MTTTFILLGILSVLILGFVQLYNRYLSVKKKFEFAVEYREKYVEFANKYLKTFDRFGGAGDFDGELYGWLILNLSTIENYVGAFGIISYCPPFTNLMIKNYQIITNTIPKFREGRLESVEIYTVEDCLMRYQGYICEISKNASKELKNPFIWFREGIKTILGVPITLLNWFGILSIGKANSIKESLVYRVFSGIFALITLIGVVIAIFADLDQALEFIKKNLGF